ncbi:MAG TPA: hypothetical protein PK668_18920 [Myxococcota bacterium]|nr:hypothetical protein [Myxococcota bacterium]HRY95197.1 hypothetical protein [Myxococcota bacterium]HSA20510.1 hypothetical protein [Myxococcota bacterium]
MATPTLWIGLGILGALAVLGALLLLILHRVRASLRRRVQARFPRESILLAGGANFFGRRSAGLAQLRGNGALVLTRDLLWFAQAVPARDLEIPVASIRSVTTPRSFLGKTIFRPLLAVRFEAPEGEDEIGWAVPDVEKWRQALETARASR